MPTLLLLFCLFLSGSNSCRGNSSEPVPTPILSSQAENIFLNKLREQADASKEPTVRVFLYLKIVTHLWNNPSDSIKPEAVASVAEAALIDLRAHENEIPPLYRERFRRDLMAQLRAHAPDVAARLSKEAQPDSRTEFQIAYAMLGQENGVDQAVGIMRRGIAAGKNPGSILTFFLHRLETVKPAKVPEILDAMISAEEARAGFISAASLFKLEHLYIREETPLALQRRYLIVLINRAGCSEAGTPDVDIYTTLQNALPAVDRQGSDLSALANARLSQLEGQLPAGTRERLAVDKRIEQSADPLAQLLVETEAAKDQTLREDLLTKAAPLALEKGQTRLAIDLVGKLHPENSNVRLWRDQFIEGAVSRALAIGDVEVARYGTGHIQSTGIRSSALQKIALHLHAANDSAGALEALNAALKIVNASDDGADKAVALLDLAGSYAKVDSQRVQELVRAAIKVINNTPEVMRKAGEGETAHLNDVETIMKLAYAITPTFQMLGAADPGGTQTLADSIQPRELKIAASVGASTPQHVSDKLKEGLVATSK